MSVLMDGHVYVDRWSPVCVGGHICDGQKCVCIDGWPCLCWWLFTFTLTDGNAGVALW